MSGTPEPESDPAAPAGRGPSAPALLRPVVLVGIMGAGKSSVGAALARRLGVPFRDSDHEIEAAAGMGVPEIFARFGEPEFRKGEARVIARLLAGPPAVIATGGGAFVEPETRALIAAGGVSVWLRAGLEVVWDRVKGKTGRPLLANPDPKGTLARLIERRDPVYALADVIVDSLAEERHEQAAARILAGLAAHAAGHPDRAALPGAPR